IFSETPHSTKDTIMRPRLPIAMALTALLALALPAAAQQPPDAGTPSSGTAAAPVTPAETPAATTDAAAAAAAAAESSWKKGRPIMMQYFRPQDKRGVNMFETTKDPGVEFTGFKLDVGAAFASQLQNLSHSNTALPNIVNGVDTNQLMD